MARNQLSSRQILQDILATEVKLEGAQENVRILKNVCDVLIQRMKDADPLFNKVFNRIFETGSYFDGLRVKEATEFDLNVVLEFPFKSWDFEISSSSSVPSFAKFHLTTEMKDLLTRNEWKEIKDALKLFTEDYLMPEKVRRWFQGVVDKVKNSLLPIQGVSQITVSASGPARTLCITKTDGVQIAVDFVPVVEFRWPNWPRGAKQQFPKQTIQDHEKFWFLVPKPAPSELAGPRERPDKLWRLHFPAIEQHLLHDKGCAKPVIKLMKLLRDRQRWDCLASYYLKTVVMWSILDDDLNWNIVNLDDLFLKMLKKLNEHVKNKMLPYLFYPSFNLLYKLEQNQALATSVHGSLSRIIRNIESDPAYYNKLLKENH